VLFAKPHTSGCGVNKQNTLVVVCCHGSKAVVARPGGGGSIMSGASDTSPGNYAQVPLYLRSLDVRCSELAFNASEHHDDDDDDDDNKAAK